MLSFARIICVGAFVAFAFAENTFTSITGSTNLTPGHPFVITWTTDSSPTVTLTLRQGDASDLETVGTIAVNIPNTGSYTWYPENTVTTGNDYALEIAGSEGDPNYSHYFGIGGSNTQSSSGTASGSATDSTSATSSLPASLVTDSISMTPAASGSAVTIVSGNSTFTSFSSASAGSSASSGSTTSGSSGTITSSGSVSRTQSAASASSSHSAASNLISETFGGTGFMTLIALSLSSMVFWMCK